MTTVSSSSSASLPYGSKGLSRIVGVACIAGFLLDMIAAMVPPSIGSVEWRLGFLQQFSDRSIILLFGLALLMLSAIETRLFRKRLALICLLLGVALNLLCLLTIRDGLALQDQALSAISVQSNNLQTQIQSAQSSPNKPAGVTPENLERASQTLNTQAETLKKNAKTGIFKRSLASVGNFIIVGVALIGLGQFGIRPRS